MEAVSGEVAPVNDGEDRFVGTSESDPEHWLLDWLTAGQLPRFNRKGTLRLVQRAGLGAWLAGVEPGLLRAARDRALSQWEAMCRNGIQAVVLGHKGYPFGLSQVPDAPWILFVKGPISLLHGPRPIAVVGTRRVSVSGRLAVDGLMDGMKGLDWTLISGMADGVDALAHRAALDRGIPTIACLAHGLHAVHPRTNAALAERILDAGGCWVSEYRLGMPPSKYTFPARNRIIAGLSEAVVVVESNKPGGSLITARLGQDYDRRVFALSPAWGSDGMKGNAHLIQEHVAEMLHMPTDLAAAMGWVALERSEQREDDPILAVLHPYEPRGFDAVVASLEWDRNAVRTGLLEAELKGWVRAWPGDRFTRTMR